MPLLLPLHALQNTSTACLLTDHVRPANQSHCVAMHAAPPADEEAAHMQLTIKVAVQKMTQHVTPWSCSIRYITPCYSSPCSTQGLALSEHPHCSSRGCVLPWHPSVRLSHPESTTNRQASPPARHGITPQALAVACSTDR